MMEERVIRALLVEDSEEDAEVILATLASGGFSVVSRRVETAEQLRTALQSDDWSVVLSDFNLPNFSAIEALEILRTLRAQVPMIVVTGAIGEESAAAVIKAGATDLVTKQGLHRLMPVVERNLRELDSLRQYEAALAALNESEARFRAIAANLPGVVFQALLYDDGSADLAYVSEGSHLVLGVTADVLMSHPEMILDMILPEDRNSFVAARIQSATQLAPLNWEGRIRIGANGQEIKWVNLRASVRRLSSGVVISDGIISNITESKLAQQSIEGQQQQLRQLASHIERVKEEERAHVAREIHDDLGGTLTAAKIDLAWIRGRLNPDQTALAEKADAMEALLDSAIEATGRISRSLRPLVLDYGVAAAIEWQVKEFRKRMGITCDFVCSREDIVLDREFSTALFRIFQETLTNIAKHAGASHVDISLEDNGSAVLLTVTDDGQGIDAGDMHKNGSYGIRGMRERADFLGGTIDISGASGAGTQVRVCLPAKRPSHAAEF
ncbi:MAG: response regulator [Betaproteobacteria bacterium]|nr:response regulator [Betaproteobacteria bacterium]